MPPLAGAQLEGRRPRRRRELRRDPRALISAAIPSSSSPCSPSSSASAARTGSQAGPLASPVPSPDLGSGARPPELVIARADGVEVHIPVDPQRVTAIAFHAINDPSGVAMAASGGAAHPPVRAATARARHGRPSTWARRRARRSTPPVNGVIASVSDYTVSGRIEGYEVTITPSVAATGLVLRMTHLDAPAAGERPTWARRCGPA